MSVFLDRERELSQLHERYQSDGAEFMVLYGRRRVGKSELIDQFLRTSRGIHLIAREESKQLQLRKFSADLSAYFQDPFLQKNGFSDWDSFFEYLIQHADPRVVVAIDEFPYLIKEDPSLPSVLQEYWDTHLKNTSIFLILSGSSISMMESATMDYKSPLFGRRTGQILLHPLRFIHVLDYLGDMKKAVEFYAVFGGTPAYLMAADPEENILKNIEEKVMREDSFLFRDVDFVLRTELVEPRYYFSILYSLAQGNNRIGLICNDTGLSKSVVNKYLSILIDLKLVHRRIPVTEGQKSRKGLYFLSDNLFDFWFSFVNPYLDTLERGNAPLIVDRYVRPHFARYVGKHFEGMVTDLFDSFNRHGLLPFVFTRIGSWWHRGEEIDIVCLAEDEHRILFCECKWQDGVDATEVIAGLRRKAPLVSWHNDRRKECFCVVARSFSRRADGEDICLDLDDCTALVEKVRTGKE
ncbi:ATP-binding protein [Methanofollis formosanus]|uniref:ATP-binding protein n=1 Tax=Methanofollis formosanus TaxID=299308 RepID=A0A8G1EF29_9EURY|nr:ATP-binding protein [Methanofollis formosanus]QYZ78435.1 ATP-binding protein [Methanofollis formosanus]